MDAQDREPARQNNVVARQRRHQRRRSRRRPRSATNCAVSHNLFTTATPRRAPTRSSAHRVFAGGSSRPPGPAGVLARARPASRQRQRRQPTAASGPTPSPGRRRRRPAPPAPARTVEGLVAAYGFNETRGTRATDSSGGGHHARLRGARHTRTRALGHGALLQRPRFVSIPRSATRGLRSFTLEAWMRPSTSAAPARCSTPRPGPRPRSAHAAGRTSRSPTTARESASTSTAARELATGQVTARHARRSAAGSRAGSTTSGSIAARSPARDRRRHEQFAVATWGLRPIIGPSEDRYRGGIGHGADVPPLSAVTEPHRSRSP